MTPTFLNSNIVYLLCIVLQGNGRRINPSCISKRERGLVVEGNGEDFVNHTYNVFKPRACPITGKNLFSPFEFHLMVKSPFKILTRKQRVD